MSNGFRCDRCKSFYERHGEDNEKRLSYQGIKIYGISLIDGYQNRLVSFDLCPECVKTLDIFMNHPDMGYDGLNYCPNCGAKMEVEE